MHGTHGTALGTGDIILAGGTVIVVGHTIGIGITAMHSIIIIVAALSTTLLSYAPVIMSYSVVFHAESMLPLTPIARSSGATQV